MTTGKITGMALLVALGTAASFLPGIPLYGAKIFPVQHAINVMAAVIFGPGPAVLVAFLVGLLRNLLATGTILAFPGGMIGAFVAGCAYRLFKRDFAASIGEVVGTGILGAMAAFPLARFILGRDVLAFTYVIPFAASSAVGAAAGLLVLRIMGAVWQNGAERGQV